MMRKMVPFICIVFLGISFGEAQENITAEEVINRVQEQISTETPLRVSFQQVFEWKLTGNVEQVDGEMILHGLDQFRITTPDQTVVSNGNTMWTYSRLENQVLIDNVREDPRSLMPRDIFFSYQEDYDVSVWRRSVQMEGEPTIVLQMDPIDQDQYVQETRVWVNTNTWHPEQVQFTDINENETTYLISSVEEDITQ